MIPDHLQEMENHLRDSISELESKNLNKEEAFLIATKRMGNMDILAKEFSQQYNDRLWKQFVFESQDKQDNKKTIIEIGIIILFCLLAGSLAQIPKLFGHPYIFYKTESLVFFKNLSFFIFPSIIFYLIWKRGLSLFTLVWTVIFFGITFFLINFLPYVKNTKDYAHTELLSAIHLPIFLWFFIGIIYLRKNVNNIQERMDFIRFTGETFVYSVLILCGAIVLNSFSTVLFNAIGIKIQHSFGDYLLSYTIFSAPILAIFLVETKKTLIESFAPVLARIFSPLFLLILLIYLATMFILKKSPYMDRNFLIWLNLLLVMVLGIALYSISSRPLKSQMLIYDFINSALIIAALTIDIIALSAIIFRINTWGISPNKLAALGENILLLINLSGLIILYLLFWLKKIQFSILEKYQTIYLTGYMLWFAIIIMLFPFIFQFK